MMEGLCFYSSKYRVTKGFKFHAQPQTGAYSCSGYVVSSTTRLSSWLVTESYGYRWYDAVPRMMQETQAAHSCEET